MYCIHRAFHGARIWKFSCMPESDWQPRPVAIRHRSSGEGENNFASTFAVLDLMFGTYYLPKRELPTAMVFPIKASPQVSGRSSLTPSGIRKEGSGSWGITSLASGEDRRHRAEPGNLLQWLEHSRSDSEVGNLVFTSDKKQAASHQGCQDDYRNRNAFPALLETMLV